MGFFTKMSFLKPTQEKLEKFYAVPIIGMIPSVLNVPVTICRWIRGKNINDANNANGYRYVECNESKIGILYSIANTLTLSFLGTYIFFKDLTNFKVIFA